MRFAAKIQEQRKRQAVNISIDRKNVIDSKHVEPLDALSGAGPHLLWRLQKLDKRKCGHLSSELSVCGDTGEGLPPLPRSTYVGGIAALQPCE